MTPLMKLAARLPSTGMSGRSASLHASVLVSVSFGQGELTEFGTCKMWAVLRCWQTIIGVVGAGYRKVFFSTSIFTVHSCVHAV